MKRIKLTITCILLLTIMVLTACGSDGDGTSTTDNSAETESDNVLRVASTPTGPPYTFMNNETEEMEGIMIDIANAIGERLDKEIEIHPMTFASLIQALEGDKVDVISAGMVMTDERREVIDFTDEVFGFGEGLVVHEDNNEIHSFEDLEGKNVGSQKGTIYHDLLEESGLPESITVYEAIGDMLQELSNGRLDAVITDEPVSIYLKENNPNFKIKIINDYESQIVDGVGLGVAKGNDELVNDLNEVIAELREDGTLQEIYDEWNVSWDLE